MALIGRISLIALLLAAPWVFGGVTPEAQWWLSLGVAGLLVLHLIESLVERPSGPFHLPTAVLAPVGLLVIAAVQLLPRDEPLVPQMQHAVFAELAETFGSDGPVTGTVSPASTRTQASLLFFALGAFVLGSRWFSTGPSQIWLWRALAINGAALAFFGIVQKLTWNGLLFWSVPLRQGGTPFASFVNRNNAAGYLNLCLAAALGVVILRFTAARAPLPGGRDHRPSRLPLKVRVLRAIASIDGLELAMLSLVVVLAVGIAFSLSRGGIVAMCVGLGALYWLRRRATSRKPVLAGASVLIVAVGGLLIWVGGLESVQARLNSLSDVTRVAAGRLAHWHDALGAVRDFPLLGTGLGTYRYANLPYQIHEGAAWHVNADNHYLEQLVETGVVGLLLYGFGFIATGIAARFLCRQTDNALSTAGAVGMYAVTAQAVQAVTDFGLLIPANALTFAVLIGSVCGMACAASDFHQLRAPLWLSLGRLEGRWSIAGLSLVLALAAAAFGLEMFLSTQAATARNAAVEVDVRRPLETRIEQFDVAIEQVERALRYRPDDPELRRSAALSWINRYRVAAAHELAPSLDQLAGKPLQGRRLWQATSLRILAARAAEFRKTGDVGQLRRIQQLPLIRDNLAPAREHLLEAFRHGPLTRDVSLLLANLTLLIETERNWQEPAETWLARGLFILPSSPDDLFAGAVVADLAGLMDSADRAYRRCLTVSPGHVLTVWSTLSKNRPISELLQGPIPARLDVLIPLAEHVSDDLTKGTLAIRAARLLNEENWEDPSGPTEGLRARLAELQGEPEIAISYYRSVLETDPRDEETRLRLAQLLIREERLPEAETELSLLHGLAPHRKDVLRQIEKLKQQRLHEASTTAN